MYEDTWYSYVSEERGKKDDVPSTSSKHGRKESLLKQSNGNIPRIGSSGPMIDLLEEGPKGPPKATLARRAKSYSDFYEAVTEYLGKGPPGKEAPVDPLERFAVREAENRYGLYEDDLLDASHEEYQLYRDQLLLSERHLDSLLEDTTFALDLLATLSGSFKTVESQTTAFQAQCEDLLAEQKRLRDLANEVGIDLQYYGYLEPLTRRLNSPGAGRLVRNDDFLDTLHNLNTCIGFMDRHPTYRDSNLYKTRYISLLQRSLSIVQTAFSTALREVSDEVSKELKAKENNETAEYVLLYGKYETVADDWGLPLKTILTSNDFAFGRKDDLKNRNAYIAQYHELFKQITETYLKSRDSVGPLVLKNLRRFAVKDPKENSEIKFFVRRCVQYVFDICNNELKLMNKFFHDGPLAAEYPESVAWNTYGDYAEKLEQNRLSHLKILHNFLAPYLSNGDLHRICDLVNWLESVYLGSVEGEEDHEVPPEHNAAAHALLHDHLWPLSDTLFIQAASEIQHFKPTPADLKIIAKPPMNEVNGDEQSTTGPSLTNAFPTVKTAVSLLVMYNDSMYDRPRKGDVLYEIVHQATESLQRAATIIKRNSTIMDAQVFLIKNLMLIENLFMTHEIPDSIRQHAELDFSPIWDTIRELQSRKQLFNPLAYINPLVQGNLLPAVVDRVLDARKEMEKVLVQQITTFTKHWRSRLGEGKKLDAVAKATKDLETLLNGVFEDETTKAALWKMIRSEEMNY